MKRIVFPIAVLLLVLVGGSADAATVRAEATPQFLPGYIEPGTPFTIDLYMNNDDGVEMVGYSMPFALYSPDASITNIIHRNVGGFSADSIPYGVSYNDSSILMLNGFDGYWTLINKWFGFGWNGVLPDTINHSTATMTGWPSGLGEQLYIQFALQVDEEGTLCIDSIGHANPIYDWLFDFPTTFEGPYCWVIGYPPEDPEIAVDKDSLTFASIQGQGAPSPQVINITNVGAGTLEWTATWTSSWLNSSPAFGTAPSLVQVSVNPSGLTPGIYYDTLVISDPEATNNPVSIPVTYTLSEPAPMIDLDPDYFSFSAIADSTNPPDQFMDVSNAGGGTLNWTATKSTTWLSISPDAGTGAATVTLSVDITGLAFGIYWDTIVVADPNASNTPQRAVVRLEIVSSLPVLGVDPELIYVAVDTDEPVPDDRYFDVINEGAGSMNYYLEETSDRILSLTPDSGAVPQTVTIVFDTVFGNPGQNFFDTIIVNSLEASNSPVEVVIQYALSTSPAKILVNKDSVSAELYECGQGTGLVIPTKITVYNGGAEPFDFDITNSAAWLEPFPSSGPAPQQVTLNFDYKSLSPGTYRDTLVITAFNAINSPRRIPVRLTILPTDEAPEITASHDTVVFAAQENQPGKEYFLSVNNANPGCMTWEFVEDVSWVDWTIDSAGGYTYPWTVRLFPNGYGLVLGTYYDYGQIVAPDATNSPQDVYFKINIWKLHGDCDYNGVINLLDVIYFINFLYYGGPAPMPERIVGDCNCDFRINLVDIIAIIDYLYYGAGPLCGNPY